MTTVTRSPIGVLRSDPDLLALLEEAVAESRSRAFLRALNDPAARPPAGLSVRNLSGTSGGTLNQVILRHDGTLVLSEKARRKAPSLAAVPLEAPGDGTIAAHAAELPPALAAHAAAPTVAVPADHMAVVQRGTALDGLVRFLVS